MATASHIFLACLAVAGSVDARVPEKGRLDRYESLWVNSPFCSKPVKMQEPGKDFLADWLLGGVSEIEGGYRVTLSHRHHAGEQVVIRPSGTDHYFPDRVEAVAAGTFEIERVVPAGDWRDLEVHLIAGGQRGSLKFDEKAVLPATAPTRAGQPGHPIQKRLQPVPAIRARR
jgi:hypothetical protein